MDQFEKVCLVCGVQFLAQGRKTRYCPSCKLEKCREAGRKNKNRPYHKTEREAAKQREQLKAKKTPGFKPAKCPEDCIYIQRIHGNPMCGYLEITDELRGCDPGIGCKRYVGKNEDLKAARHRKVTWDVTTGKKLWEAGWKDSMIAKVMRVSPDAVKSYRRRVWEKEKKND